MPNYPYLCKSCHDEAEEIRHVDKRDDRKECPTCGEPMIRLVGSFMNDYKPTHSRHVEYQEEV